LELFDILYTNALDDSPLVRISSILTIGYISDEINPDLISNEQKNNFLFRILLNLNPENEELINTALDALIKFLPMIRSNIEAEVKYFLIYFIIIKI